MSEADKRPQKRYPVHQPLWVSGNRSVIIFLTVCVANRRPLLATPEMHGQLLAAWRKAEHWRVGRYVVMPDHVHLFCAPGSYPPMPLTGWVAYWKRIVAFNCGGTFWQKNYWDSQLRSHESYEQKWNYVRANPVRAKLSATADHWPFQGEPNLLRWHN